MSITVKLSGNIITRPEIYYTKNNKMLCKFSISTNINNKDSNYKCVAWNDNAEKCSIFNICDYVELVGYSKFERWIDNTGKHKSQLIIHIKNINKANNKDIK